MSKLSYDFKLPGRSTPEVHSRFEDALVLHQKSRKVKWGKRKLTAEALVNAAMMHFLDLDVATQEDVLGKYVPLLEAMMRSDEVAAVPPPKRKPQVGGTIDTVTRRKVGKPAGKGRTGS